MHAARLVFHARALLSVCSQEGINCLYALSMRMHPAGMEGATGTEVFIFWLEIQFCLNGSILKATWDRAHVTGTFLAMASLFARALGRLSHKTCIHPASRMPNVKSKADPKRQQTQLPEAIHLGCSRRPGSQANKHGAGGVERILHGSCVRHSPERSISFAAGAKGEGKLQLIRRKGGRGEEICGCAKTFVNKLHCNVADERATPGKRDPVLRHKSGATPAKSRKSRRHKQEENHPLLLPNNSPGPPNTIPPSHIGAVRLGGSSAECLQCWRRTAEPPNASPCPGLGSEGASTEPQSVQEERPVVSPPASEFPLFLPRSRSLKHTCTRGWPLSLEGKGQLSRMR